MKLSKYLIKFLYLFVEPLHTVHSLSYKNDALQTAHLSGRIRNEIKLNHCNIV